MYSLPVVEKLSFENSPRGGDVIRYHGSWLGILASLASAAATYTISLRLGSLHKIAAKEVVSCQGTKLLGLWVDWLQVAEYFRRLARCAGESLASAAATRFRSVWFGFTVHKNAAKEGGRAKGQLWDNRKKKKNVSTTRRAMSWLTIFPSQLLILIAENGEIRQKKNLAD